jgi:hypothetical protein
MACFALALAVLGSVFLIAQPLHGPPLSLSRARRSRAREARARANLPLWPELNRICIFKHKIQHGGSVKRLLAGAALYTFGMAIYTLGLPAFLPPFFI